VEYIELGVMKVVLIRIIIRKKLINIALKSEMGQLLWDNIILQKGHLLWDRGSIKNQTAAESNSDLYCIINNKKICMYVAAIYKFKYNWWFNTVIRV